MGREEEATVAISPGNGISLGNHTLNSFISEFEMPSIWVPKEQIGLGSNSCSTANSLAHLGQVT